MTKTTIKLTSEQKVEVAKAAAGDAKWSKGVQRETAECRRIAEIMPSVIPEEVDTREGWTHVLAETLTKCQAELRRQNRRSPSRPLLQLIARAEWCLRENAKWQSAHSHQHDIGYVVAKVLAEIEKPENRKALASLRRRKEPKFERGKRSEAAREYDRLWEGLYDRIVARFEPAGKATPSE